MTGGLNALICDRQAARVSNEAAKRSVAGAHRWEDRVGDGAGGKCLLLKLGK